MNTQTLKLISRLGLVFGVMGIIITSQSSNMQGFSGELVEVNIILKNHQFEPSVILLAAGQGAKLVIDNQDEEAEEFESPGLKKEKILVGQSKTTIMLAGLAKGSYEFEGEFHPKTAFGKIVVE